LEAQNKLLVGANT